MRTHFPAVPDGSPRVEAQVAREDEAVTAYIGRSCDHEHRHLPGPAAFFERDPLDPGGRRDVANEPRARHAVVRDRDVMHRTLRTAGRENRRQRRARGCGRTDGRGNEEERRRCYDDYPNKRPHPTPLSFAPGRARAHLSRAFARSNLSSNRDYRNGAPTRIRCTGPSRPTRVIRAGCRRWFDGPERELAAAGLTF